MTAFNVHKWYVTTSLSMQLRQFGILVICTLLYDCMQNLNGCRNLQHLTLQYLQYSNHNESHESEKYNQ